MDDWQLLRQFVEHNSQEAFAVLTQRYLNLVYSVCRRELDNTETAEDVTQAVFLILARKAPSLRRGVVLSGWLFQTARFVAKNTRLQAQRRAAYEQKAAEAMQQSEGREDAAWAEIEPLLNGSLAALREGERQCVLLRFFQGLSFAEAGTALGLSEEAARKCVTRALEKMRRFFGNEGVIVPGVALAALLSAHAAKAAPLHLTGDILQLPAGQVSGSALQITQGALRTMKLMMKWKIAAGVAAFLGIGTTTYGIALSAAASAQLDLPAPVQSLDLPAPGRSDVTRNVILKGEVRYEDGKPAGGIPIGAQLQNAAMVKLDESYRKSLGVSGGTFQLPKEEQEQTWNNTLSKPDGTYELPVGADLPYNVMVFDASGKWVAHAVEGVFGGKNSTVTVPDLVLTKGCLVIGKVVNAARLPSPQIMIGTYGPARPETTAAVDFVKTDLTGHYKLRVAPGKNRIYLGNVSHTLNLKPGQIVTLNF